MMIVLRSDAEPHEVEHVCRMIEQAGLRAHAIRGPGRVAIGVTGNTASFDPGIFAGLPGVIEIIRVTQPYKLTSREMKPDDTVVELPGVRIGGPHVVVIAGPCAVESREQVLTTARHVQQRGARLLRGGAYKPRTSPYAFQGLGPEGLALLAEAGRAAGLPTVSEALSGDDLPLVERHADVIQIGARSMTNYPLLKLAGEARKPILLKRGMAATLEELLLAAEYVMAQGNRAVILCERGIRTFSDHARFTLDISIVPELKRVTHLPVIVDPSHAAGRRELVAPLARAAIAAGADGVMVEVHNEPMQSLSDPAQALTFEQFDRLMTELRSIATAMGRVLAGA
jgi:3-deoxy-7-phosphoheptulonate synthase